MASSGGRVVGLTGSSVTRGRQRPLTPALSGQLAVPAEPQTPSVQQPWAQPEQQMGRPQNSSSARPGEHKTSHKSRVSHCQVPPEQVLCRMLIDVLARPLWPNFAPVSSDRIKSSPGKSADNVDRQSHVECLPGPVRCENGLAQPSGQGQAGPVAQREPERSRGRPQAGRSNSVLLGKGDDLEQVAHQAPVPQAGPNLSRVFSLESEPGQNLGPVHRADRAT